MKWRLLVPGFALALLAIAGTAAACDGLSPGDELNVGNSICTLGFLVADPQGLYFTTAGHCIQVDETASSPNVGEWGRGVFHFLDPETGSEQDGSPGNDFALIRVNPDAYASLNPKMCGWEGPTGIYDDKPGSGGVSLYGHALLFGDAGDLGLPTYKREGMLVENSDDSFAFIAPSLMGDSGSAVLHEDGRALGVLTHLTIGIGGGTQGGTTLPRGFRLAAEAGFPDLRLVLAGEDPVQVMTALRNAPAPTSEPTPTPSTTDPKPSPTPANGAPPPSSNQTQPTPPDDSIAPASTREDEVEAPSGDKSIPGPALALVALAAVGAAVLRRRER